MNKSKETPVYRLDGTLERVFPSRVAASRFMGMSQSHLYHYADGRPIKGRWRLLPAGPTLALPGNPRQTVLYLPDGAVFAIYPSRTAVAKALGVHRSQVYDGAVLRNWYGVGERGLAVLAARVDGRTARFGGVVACTNVTTGERREFPNPKRAASELGLPVDRTYYAVRVAKAGRRKVVGGWSFGDLPVPPGPMPALTERQEASVAGWKHHSWPMADAAASFHGIHGFKLPPPGSIFRGMVLHVVHKGVSHVWVKPTSTTK